MPDGWLAARFRTLERQIGVPASPDESPSGQPQRAPTLLATAIGGVRGLVDGSLPALVFVIANAVAGLHRAVVLAIIVGILIFALRLVRREPVTQAFYGFIAVAVAAYLAARTGKAQDFFLPGIAINAIYGTAGLLSLLVGRPLGGYALAALDTRYARWRQERPMRRAAALITLTWTLVFAVRVVVQGLLYLAGSTGWLAATKIGMGWPLTGLAAAVTLWMLRRLSGGTAGAAVPVQPPAAAYGTPSAGRPPSSSCN